VHKSYTDNRKLRMIIVNDQWTAIVANFIRKSSNSFKENSYLCHDRQRQEKPASLILVLTQSTCWKSITLNELLRYIISTRQMNS